MVETTTTRNFFVTTSLSFLNSSFKPLFNGGENDLEADGTPSDGDYVFDRNFTTRAEDLYPVEVSKLTDFTASVVLVVGLVGNLFGICVFTCHSSGKKPMVLDKIVTFLCFTGLTATLITAPLHLYASKTMTYPMDASFCQIQGLLLNLLCLVSLWYTAVLSTERFFRLVSPHEHRLTFSPLNLNVILAGVFVLLVVEVSGPIYGWAEYGFLNDSRVCLLNPESKHIFTYSVIHVTCYVAVPIVTTFGFTSYVIHQGMNNNDRLARGSQVLTTAKGVLVLCLAMVLTMLLLLPYHATLLLQATFVPLTVQQKVIGYWLHIIAITCVYPVTLLSFGSKEVFPVLKAILSGTKTCFCLQPRLGGGRIVEYSSADSEGIWGSIRYHMESVLAKPLGRNHSKRGSLTSNATELATACEATVVPNTPSSTASGNL